MPLDYNSLLTPVAKDLRKDMTPQERKLWYAFLSKQPIRFRRQKPIGNFIVDCYCHQAQLVIEIDGKQHRDELGLASDRERDAFLSGPGLTVLRFTNQDIEYSFHQTCEKINQHLGRS